jgi:DNA-binding NtrC family response regulator
MNSVILVEDNTNLRTTLKKLLSILGYEVIRVYENGSQAKADLHENPIDAHLLITDFFMPKMNADEMIKSISSNERYKDIQYIVMSGFEIDTIINRFPKDSGIKFLTKPFKVDDLGRLLQ